MSVINVELLTSSSPHLKAADHQGLNKTCVIKSAGEDVLNYPGEEPKHGYIVDCGAEKPIWLSKTNLKALVAQFGNDTDGWVGKSILLTTKDYDIEGKKSTGWITTPIADAGFEDEIPF